MSNELQGTLTWLRLRIGMLTASECGVLLQNSTKKDCIFGEKAMDYINDKVLERMIKQSIIDDDEQFELYIRRVNKGNFTMDYGSDMEELAKEIYTKKTGIEIQNAGFVKINDYLGDSADGVCVDRCIETKCPTPKKHLYYMENIHTAQDLLKLDKNYKTYYTQCQLHCVAHNKDFCDWVSFDYMNKRPLHIVQVPLDKIFIEQLMERLELANNFINEKVEKLLSVQKN